MRGYFGFEAGGVALAGGRVGAGMGWRLGTRRRADAHGRRSLARRRRGPAASRLASFEAGDGA